MSLWGMATQSARKEKIKKLEKELGWIKDIPPGTLIICPFCNYITDRGRGSAKVFQDGETSSFKCFSCGQWRKI